MCTSIPKHRYIFWLAMLDKLKTRDKLKLMGVIDDESCSICHASKESIEHLFFECKFSSSCLSLLSAWLGIRFHMRKLSTISPGTWKVPKLMKQLVIASICSLIYLIWKARNTCVWQLHNSTPVAIMKELKLSISYRFKGLYPEATRLYQYLLE